ncbi:MAG: tetratricopeptide repeat protein, partial [Planctomycetota bacterium]
MNDYFDLGHYSYPITTSSENAQTWFDRGLVWCYGFNHEEAIRCFEKVVELDPKCAMGYWGMTYAASSFYNKPWEWYGEREVTESIKFCHENIQMAIQNNSLATPLEQHLISALSQKHPDDKANDLTTLNLRERIYAQSMCSVLEKYPLDRDIICLTAESMMNLTRWKLWDIHQGIPAPGALTEESIEILERALSLTEQGQLTPHPGILHFHIHAFEMSPWPEKALASANQLRDISTESGHLLHMSTHIDVLCGQYLEAVEANNRAIKADLKYINLRGKREFYLISCLHDFHSKIYAAMFLGQFAPAMEAAE